MDINDSFKMLEIESTDSIQEVKQAYRDIVFVWHPDKFGGNQRIQQKAENKIKQINEAYEILKSHLLSQPPQLTKIIILPDTVEIEYNQSQSFTILGINSEGNQAEVEQVIWESDGGIIYQNGLFFANDNPGNYVITATVGNLQVYALVVIKTVEVITNNASTKIPNKLQEPCQVDDQNILIKNDDKQEVNGFIRFVQSVFKISVWGLIFWLCMVTEYDSPTSTLEKIWVFLLFSWIVGLICPNAVIKFGLPKNRATVSKLYTTLCAVDLSLGMSIKERVEGLNNTQSAILLFFTVMSIFAILYPQGTIFGDNPEDDPEQKRFTLGCGVFILGLFIIGIIGGLRAVF